MADAQANATLTSLPHELLAAIAWLVAPDGGRKAANLRLACRAVDSAAAPCVWTAITFPSAPEEVDLLLSHLIENPHKRVEFTSSVRIDATTPLISTIAALLPTFPRLKRVHISGAGAEHALPELLPLLMRAIDRSPTVRTLVFDHISFANELDQPVWSFFAVPEVTFLACLYPGNLFIDENTLGPKVTDLTSVSFRAPIGSVEEQVEAAVHLAYAMSASGRVYELELSYLDDEEHPLLDYMENNADDWSYHTGPLEIVLHGFNGLFDAQDLKQQDTVALFTIALLNWIGCCTTLSLPVHAVFDFNNEFHLLDLRNLQHLALVSQALPIAGTPNLLSLTTYKNLLNFLDIEPLPALRTLRLRGWLDFTNVKTIALGSDWFLMRQHLEIFGLLSCLVSTGVVELRLQNSIGHPDELEECVFERDDKDATAWRKRRVTFF
ncbi:hypothetical protein RQP46_006143 [Phenoliferia psychrophenolica]